jgi:hypothetical protein
MKMNLNFVSLGFLTPPSFIIMETKSTIYGHIISHDDSVSAGMYFLTRVINQQEAKVFFDEAYNYGSATFEDRMGYKFKLIHQGGEYQLVKPQL